jgi:hypothetical protein
MGTPVTGVGGQIKVGATVIANINTWSITEKVATADTTVFQVSGNWQTNAATIKSWTAKFDGFVDPADATQLSLINGLGSTFAFEFDTDPTLHKWNGSGILTGIDPKADIKGMVTVAFAVDGTGALTFT